MPEIESSMIILLLALKLYIVIRNYIILYYIESMAGQYGKKNQIFKYIFFSERLTDSRFF